MNISRPDKYLRELLGTSTLAEARTLRQRDLELMVSDRTSIVMGRAAVALGLRTFQGSILVRGKANPALAAGMCAEATEYGQPERLRFNTVAPAPYVLGLGCAPANDAPFVDASGWNAATNVLLPPGRTTAVADAFAVAAGFAKLFAGIVGRPSSVISEQWRYSLRDLSSRPGTVSAVAHLELGEIALIGAGAIGSAVAFVLRHSGWGGHLRIYDDERYDGPNHETTLLISREDALRQRRKAETLAARAQREGLRTTGFHTRVGAGHEVTREQLSAILCSVDNPETRRDLDGTHADVLLNAGVGGARVDAGHLLYSVHARAGIRLSDLYRAPNQSLAAVTNAPQEAASDECSRIAYGRVAAAAPFMALGAGALLVAGIARQVLGDTPAPNYIKFNLLGLLERHQSQSR